MELSTRNYTPPPAPRPAGSLSTAQQVVRCGEVAERFGLSIVEVLDVVAYLIGESDHLPEKR